MVKPGIEADVMVPTSSLQAVFLFSFLAAIGAVISPGPVSAAIVSQAPRRSWLAGHSVLELGIVLLIAFGLSAWLARPWIQTAIALLGGLRWPGWAAR